MGDYGFEHPDSDGAIYRRKHGLPYRDSNTGEEGRTKAEVRAKNAKHNKGRPQSVSGVGHVKTNTISFPHIKQSYRVVRKKKR